MSKLVKVQLTMELPDGVTREEMDEFLQWEFHLSGMIPGSTLQKFEGKSNITSMEWMQP